MLHLKGKEGVESPQKSRKSRVESPQKEMDKCWKNQDTCSALINNRRGQVRVKKAEKEKAVYESAWCSQDPSL